MAPFDASAPPFAACQSGPVRIHASRLVEKENCDLMHIYAIIDIDRRFSFIEAVVLMDSVNLSLVYWNVVSTLKIQNI